MYEGPPENRGFTEYGGDWLAVDDRVSPTHIIVGQDKDYKRLRIGDMDTRDTG